MVAKKFPVEAGHILMFARSVGDPNPVYADAEAAEASEAGGIVAPPTFAQASAQFDPDYPLRPKFGEVWFGSGSLPSGRMKAEPPAASETDTAKSGDEADSNGSDSKESGSGAAAGGLHAEQHFTYHRHMRPGDVLTATTRPGETWEKQSRRAGKLTFSESVTEYRDQDGELVVTARGVGVRTEKIIKED